MYRRYRRKLGNTQDFQRFITLVGLSAQVGFIMLERVGHCEE